MIRIPLPKKTVPEFVACVSCNVQLWGRLGDEDATIIRGLLNAFSNYQARPHGLKYSVGFTLPSDPVSSAKQD
jgi:hypothetical protein